MKDPGIEPGRTQGLLRLPIHRLDGPCAGYERQLELRRDPGARCYGVKSVAHSVVTWRVIVARLQQRAAGFPVDAENSKGAIDLRKLSGATASDASMSRQSMCSVVPRRTFPLGSSFPSARRRLTLAATTA